MKFDLATILEHFCIEDGFLYRKYATGRVKRVTVLEAGRLTSMVNGRKYYGPDIAWAYHYLAVPQHRVVTIDLDPHNLAIENLGAARRKRLIFRPVHVPGGVRHPLSQLTFGSMEYAKSDWIEKAQAYYAADLKFVLFSQRTFDDLPASRVLEKERAPRVVGQRGPKRSVTKPPKPETLMGRKWVWFREQWVSIPFSCHPSDDWMVRAAAVLEDPDARFVYDAPSDRTLTVWSEAVAA